MKVPILFRSTHPWRRANLIMFGIFVIFTGLLAFDLIDIKAHDKEWFLAWMMALSAVSVLIPYWIVISIKRLRSNTNENFVALTESILIIAMLLSWIGAFGPYRWGLGYDSFVHFSASVLAGIFFASVAYAIKAKWSRNSIAVFLFVVGMSILAGIGNELFEKYGDIIWGTKMFGEAGQANDTTIDYIYDFIGAIIGALVGIANKKRIKQYIGV